MANPASSCRGSPSSHHIVPLQVLAFTLMSCYCTSCLTMVSAEEMSGDMDKTAQEWTTPNSSLADAAPLGPITILPGDCLHELFSKYSTDGRMDADGFEKLLRNLGLGEVQDDDEDDDDHHADDHDDSHHNNKVTDSNKQNDYHQTQKSASISDRDKRAVANTTSAPAANEGKATSYVPTPISKPSALETKTVPVSGDSMTTGTAGVTSNDTIDHGVHTDHHQDDNHQTQCLSAEAVLDIFDEGVPERGLTENEFLQACPVLLQQLDSHACVKFDVNNDHPGGITDKTRCETEKHDMEEPTESSMTGVAHIWGYAFAAVTLISMASIVCILVVPCMQRFPLIYARLLSFLVAMAVGTLSGDAVMHLMPHAFGFHGHKEEPSPAVATAIPGCAEVVTSGHGHGSTSTSFGLGSEEPSMANNVVIKGLVVLMGIFSFFVIEQLMQLCRNCKQKRHKSGGNGSNYTQLKPKENVGSKLCNHNAADRLSVVTDPSAAAQLDALLSSEKSQPTKASVVYNCHDRRDSQTSNNSQHSHHSQHVTICVHSDAQIHISPNPTHAHTNDKLVDHEGGGDHKHEHNDYQHDSHDGYHDDHHHHGNLDGHGKSEVDHGHGHHGHSHGVPPPNAGIATLAWIVVMGDGLHNFCDGLVVGAAFADSLAGGLSTAIAVMCHELPHELGDFAVMLKAGMSVKQALAFQGVSSILAYAGMAIGVAMGNVSMLSLWIFALAAGMFLYIALADLFPEMVETISTTTDGKGCHLLLQALGVMCGIGLMLTIGLLEEDLMAALTRRREV